MIEVRAPAKLNLTLEVLGRRPDGYHEIASVMQAVDIVDTLAFEPGDALVLTCDYPELAGPDNLVLRAAALLSAEAASPTSGARIHLQKQIPIAAGLGGGSSDAAATLVGLRALWKKDVADDDLRLLGSRLGSDVPFFLLGRATALATGRGDILRPLPPLPPVWAVVLVPDVRIPEKTRTLYGLLTAADYGSGELTARAVAALERAERPAAELFGNGFERTVFAACPEVAAAHRRFLAAGAPWAHLTGSGPALYCLLPQRRTAAGIYHRLQDDGCRVYLAKTRSSGLAITSPW